MAEYQFHGGELDLDEHPDLFALVCAGPVFKLLRFAYMCLSQRSNMCTCMCDHVACSLLRACIYALQRAMLSQLRQIAV